MKSPNFHRLTLLKLGAFNLGEKLKNHTTTLTDEEFNICVEELPTIALRYPAVYQRMNKRQRRIAIKHASHQALEYLRDEMTPDEFNRCLRNAPWQALEFNASRLDDKQFAYCLRKHPPAAIRFSANRLSHEQLKRLTKSEPRIVLRYASHLLKKPTLLKTIQNNEKISLDLLSNEFRLCNPLTLAKEWIKVEKDLPFKIKERVLEILSLAL